MPPSGATHAHTHLPSSGVGLHHGGGTLDLLVLLLLLQEEDEEEEKMKIRVSAQHQKLRVLFRVVSVRLLLTAYLRYQADTTIWLFFSSRKWVRHFQPR